MMIRARELIAAGQPLFCVRCFRDEQYANASLSCEHGSTLRHGLAKQVPQGMLGT